MGSFSNSSGDPFVDVFRTVKFVNPLPKYGHGVLIELSKDERKKYTVLRDQSCELLLVIAANPHRRPDHDIPDPLGKRQNS